MDVAFVEFDAGLEGSVVPGPREYLWKSCDYGEASWLAVWLVWQVGKTKKAGPPPSAKDDN
jgi:hypothetical protein